MARSPASCSSSSMTVGPHPEMTDDVFSDDSGVDVKPQQEGLLCVRDHPSPSGMKRDTDRRHKRKSSEPKKRKEVLLMKRFRWDTDEEEDTREDNDEDVFEVLARPGSGDSGCQADDLAAVTSSRRNGQWRKATTVKREDEDCASSPLPAFRQSVIRKNETAGTCCTAAARSSPEDEEEEDAEEEEEEEKTKSVSRPPPRNYKSMSRQRRIEANARERSRVHTISAAFESLRRAVPAYAHNQKLSKLAILRIASAYIVALACLNGDATSTPPQQHHHHHHRQQQQREGGGGGDAMSECVERCTRTLQAEGRSRRRNSSKE